MTRTIEGCTLFSISFFLREILEKDRRAVFSYRGSDLHRGHYSQDDVVIRYAGFHDAAFDVNCEERRSRSRFIPPSFASSLPKDVQTSDYRRRTHVSFLLRSTPRPEDDQTLNPFAFWISRKWYIFSNRYIFKLDFESYPWTEFKI